MIKTHFFIIANQPNHVAIEHPSNDFNEVYLKASLEQCIEKDAKGLYKQALDRKDADFTALTSPYEEPENPDLLIDTNLNNEEQSAHMLIDFLQKKYKIKL